MTPAPHATTESIDRFDLVLVNLGVVPDINERRRARLDIYQQRWPAVERAVAHHGTTHREAFYGSRAYWHTGSTRGLGWALDQQGDLAEPVFVDGRGNVRVRGDADADIEILGDAVVHILGDLDATLELRGTCEVVVAGRLTKNATIICDGRLDLFVGGTSDAIIGATGSATLIIDGDAGGTLQCGAPATTLTVTGDLTAGIPAPNNKDAVLALRVDGFASTAKLLDLGSAGFTRVNATIGLSNTPAGLYPRDPSPGVRPRARWVVLQQSDQPD